MSSDTQLGLIAILYLLLVFLVPMIPAFLVYKVFPTSGADSNTAEGMMGPVKFKLVGGTATYLVLLAVAIFGLPQLIPTPIGNRGYWTITGEISVLDEKGDSVNPPQDLQAEILNPKQVYIKPDKTFSLRVPSSSPGDWPIIAFYYPNGQGRTEYNLQDMRHERRAIQDSQREEKYRDQLIRKSPNCPVFSGGK